MTDLEEPTMRERMPDGAAPYDATGQREVASSVVGAGAVGTPARAVTRLEA
jgi:hypothetical protein